KAPAAANASATSPPRAPNDLVTRTSPGPRTLILSLPRTSCGLRGGAHVPEPGRIRPGDYPPGVRIMRPMTHTPPRAALLAGCLGIAALGATGVQAADTQTQNQYQQDVAHCHNAPGINLQACLREAGAAAQAARQN